MVQSQSDPPGAVNGRVRALRGRAEKKDQARKDPRREVGPVHSKSAVDPPRSSAWTKPTTRARLLSSDTATSFAGNFEASRITGSWMLIGRYWQQVLHYLEPFFYLGGPCPPVP
jgi:hypothetical protein